MTGLWVISALTLSLGSRTYLVQRLQAGWEASVRVGARDAWELLGEGFPSAEQAIWACERDVRDGQAELETSARDVGF